MSDAIIDSTQAIFDFQTIWLFHPFARGRLELAEAKTLYPVTFDQTAQVLRDGWIGRFLQDLADLGLVQYRSTKVPRCLGVAIVKERRLFDVAVLRQRLRTSSQLSVVFRPDVVGGEIR